MGFGDNAQAAYKRYKAGKKAKEHLGTVKKLLDEDTRSGEIFKQSVKGAFKLLEKVTGAALTKHPYYMYHKAHMEALIATMDASDTHNHAMEALNSAVRSADASAVLSQSVDSFVNRKGGLKLEYAMNYSSLRVLWNLKVNPAVGRNELKQTGGSEDQLRSDAAAKLYAWQADACEVFFDAADLLAMVDVEYRATEAAMKLYNEKLAKLQKGKKTVDRVAALATIRDKQYEEIGRYFDRTNNPGKQMPSDQAVADPTLYAKRQRDKVDETVQILATICDVAMSDEAWHPTTVNLKIGTL